jgi:hypothetical protein
MRRALDQRGNDVGLVIPGAESRRSVFRTIGEIAPAAFVAELAVQSFPALGLFFRVEEWELGTLDDRDIGAAGDFEEPQGALGFLFHPLVAADGGDPQHLELVRLQKNEDRLHIGCGRPACVLIDDDLDLLRLQLACRGQDQKGSQQNNEASWLHYEEPPGVS